MNSNENNVATWVLRIGASGTYVGHGIYALSVKPEWICLITSLGFTSQFAIKAMPVIGAVDIVVALLLLLKPGKLVLVWATIWCTGTALSRVTAGQSILEFLERFANIACPLALLYWNTLKPKGTSASNLDSQ